MFKIIEAPTVVLMGISTSDDYVIIWKGVQWVDNPDIFIWGLFKKLSITTDVVEGPFM